MRKIRSIFLPLVCLLIMIPFSAFAEVKVVASLPSLGAIARAVGGEYVSVETLANNAEDPHFTAPRPDFVLKANKADLLIYNGMELEIGWLPMVQKNARNAKILPGAEGLLDVSQAVKHLGVPSGKVDRSQGDVHPQGNPHYLYALPNGIAAAKAIASRLSSIDPENAAHYQAQLDSFVKRAEEKNKEWQSKFASLSEAQRRIVSYHDSMIYLTSWLHLIQAATIEAIPGTAPGPSHVTKIVSMLRANPVSYILQESYQPKSTSEKIAKLINARVTVIDPGPNPGEDYIDYIDRTLKQFF